MISQKDKKITIIQGDIKCLMKDISYSFRNIIATKKHTLNLEYQVADITMEHDEIWYNLDEKVANSIKLSDYNY